MQGQTASCIYCGATFDPSAGDGDHIIAAALGEFSGFQVFRGACEACNNRIGRSEEELLRCSPEGYLARIADPPRRRPRDGKAWPGAKTASPPAMFIEQYGARLLARPVTRDPRNVDIVDQLVIENEKGEQFPIKVFPQMSAEAVLAKVKALNIDGKYSVNFSVSDENAEWLGGILKTLWPGAESKEYPPTEIGVHRVKGLLQFRVTDHYFRALAKIAFHYYLQYNRSGLRGNELEFAGIRQFILDGGDPDKFFKVGQDRPATFVSPFGRVIGGGMLTPANWMHMLAADDSTGKIVVYLHLFLGPGHVIPAQYVVLGDMPPTAQAKGPSSHLLGWEPGSKSRGWTKPLTLVRA